MNEFYREFVWYCDYGERDKCFEVIASIVDSQNADELANIIFFVNNNPYKLEFYSVFIYDNPKSEQIPQMYKLMTSAEAYLTTEITYKELMEQVSNRRYNFSSAPQDSSMLFYIKNSLFLYKSKEDIEEEFPTSPLDVKKKVFLSHASEDKTFVRELIPYLNGKKLPVWFDEVSIDYGEKLVPAIQLGIEESGVAIFYVTESFLQSNWCQTEMESFLYRQNSKEEVLILTIVAENIEDELPLFLKQLKYLKIEDGVSAREIAQEFIPSIKRFFKKQA